MRAGPAFGRRVVLVAALVAANLLLLLQYQLALKGLYAISPYPHGLVRHVGGPLPRSAPAAGMVGVVIQLKWLSV